MGNQIVQCLVNAGFGITAANFDVFAIHIVSRIDNGLLQILHSRLLITGGLILLVTDNILYGLGQLRHIPLLHKLANLHCAFQRFVISRTRQHHNSLSMRFCHQAQFRFFDGISGNSQKTKLHTTGYSASGHPIHHLVEVKVMFIITTELFGWVDVGIDHLGNALYDGGSIHDCIVDVTLDILFLIGEEVVDFAGPSNVVLAH